MADKRFNYTPIRPGFPWSIMLRLPCPTPLFPEGVRLRSQFRVEPGAPVLATVTTENGGLARVDDDTVLISLDPVSTQRMKNLETVQFDFARSDLDPPRSLGVTVTAKTKMPITAPR